MKKHTPALIGIILQIIGIALMLFGFINDRKLLWFGFPIVFVGLGLILFGLFRNSTKS